MNSFVSKLIKLQLNVVITKRERVPCACIIYKSDTTNTQNHGQAIIHILNSRHLNISRNLFQLTYINIYITTRKHMLNDEN